MINKNLKTLVTVHTHGLPNKWSKGGSREKLEEVSILPRDCE